MPLPARRRSTIDRMTFGGNVPWAIGLALTLTVAFSLFGAVGDRHGTSIFQLGALRPADVLGGQVWRLVTWPFLEPGPVGLIFTCIFLWWFGKDVAEELGSRRFVMTFGRVLGAAALCTCAVSLVDPDVREATYLGGFAWTSALVVAWGFWFPWRIVRVYFVIPVRGYWLAWLTIALTLVYAAYGGWEAVVPELFAEAFVVGWTYQGFLRARVASVWRGPRRRQEREKRARAARAKSIAYLRVIETDDQDPPDLPPDVAGSVESALRGKRDGSTP